MVLVTREMSRLFDFGYSGDVKVVWFWLLGRCQACLVLVTREMYTWFGFDTREMLV